LFLFLWGKQVCKYNSNARSVNLIYGLSSLLSTTSAIIRLILNSFPESPKTLHFTPFSSIHRLFENLAAAE